MSAEGGSRRVGNIKRYKIVVLGALLVVVALLAARRPKEPEPGRFQFRPPVQAETVTPAALQEGVTEGKADEEASSRASSYPSGSSEEGVAQGRQDEEVEEEEQSPADSTGLEETEFDPQEAKDEALAEVRQYEENLATVLWTYNPNARKARLKAAELAERAGEIEGWVQAQDNRVDWTDQEKKEWDAQRDVWLGHASELKEVSRRLVGSHGTRRKVRNIARDMRKRLETEQD
jgi:hypothetical protein